MHRKDSSTDLLAASTSRDDPFRERWPEPADDFRHRFGHERPSAFTRLLPTVPFRHPFSRTRPLERRLETYWRWFAIVLFVVITLDMLTTMYATDAVGLQAEANPLIRMALERGVLWYTALNLVVLFVSVGGFKVLSRVAQASDPPYDRYFERVLQLWLGLLLAAGLFVFVNNLSVIVYGQSLVG